MTPRPRDYVSAYVGASIGYGIVKSVDAAGGTLVLHRQEGDRQALIFGARVLTAHLLADFSGREQLARMREEAFANSHKP